jgi:hypothetical protein
MTDVTDSQHQRQEYAAAFRMASEQLATASRMVSEKNWTVTLFAWRYGGVLNEIHGKPAGTGLHGEGSIPASVMETYCEELGFSTQRDAYGNLGGGSRVAEFRRLAARIGDEDRLREVFEEYGSLKSVTRGFLRGTAAEETQQGQMLADRTRRSADRGTGSRRSPGYGRFVPPQDWTSYLLQRGLSRGEISACLCLVLDSVGPEQSLKIWDHAGRPDRRDDRP